MKRVFVIALAMLFVSWAGMACAQSPEQGPAPSGPAVMQHCPAPSGPGPHQHGPGHPGGPDHWGHMRHRMAKFLNLTTEQKDKMREIRQRFLTDTHDVRYDLQVKHIEMRELFTDPKMRTRRSREAERDRHADNEAYGQKGRYESRVEKSAHPRAVTEARQGRLLQGPPPRPFHAVETSYDTAQLKRPPGPPSGRPLP